MTTRVDELVGFHTVLHQTATWSFRTVSSETVPVPGVGVGPQQYEGGLAFSVWFEPSSGV